MKNLLAFSLLWLLGQPVFSQNQPKLVVGIVVDQMRQEYLYRFEKKFGEQGFKRLMSEGYMLKNAHYNYVPTETGPGHASIYTGTTPAIHGIIGNDWYDRRLKLLVNCVGDSIQKPVGTDIGGMVSPWRMLSSTITDELKLATQKRAKVVGVSVKDRGAVLPAGHFPDGAYWYDSKTGAMITSTYYKQLLPEWVTKFNLQKLPDTYLNQVWNTSLPSNQYLESGPDDSPYEGKWGGKEKTTFPYNLAELRKKMGVYSLLTMTPWGNTLVAEFAKAALVGESLGKDEVTDFLAVSFSSTDIIGHAMGPNAVELEDTYLRLDKTLEDLFAYLDKEVGKGSYTVFLTADHGVSEVPQYLTDLKVPSGYFRPGYIKSALNEHLEKYFPGKTIVEEFSSGEVYINQKAFEGDPKSSGIDLFVATELITKFLLSTEGVAQVFPSTTLRQANSDEVGIRGKVVRGFHPKRSGDIAFVLEPSWISWGGVTGSTHGSGYSYDTHIPILFYGAGIKKGSSSQFHTITDIAPTLSVLLKIKFPSGCTGQPVVEIVD
ncbi:MAG TPA: alkaline phosphatase family protein [Cyclobacteriaceae bacterium]|mgnify:CR=1 FL=1|nr:alkaline phosphatase family protein [Cyclobacteriaceae bacterium]